MGTLQLRWTISCVWWNVRFCFRLNLGDANCLFRQLKQRHKPSKKKQGVAIYACTVSQPISVRMCDESVNQITFVWEAVLTKFLPSYNLGHGGNEESKKERSAMLQRAENERV